MNKEEILKQSITIEEVIKWKPCWGPAKVAKLFTNLGKDRLTIKELIDLHGVKAYDKLWAITHKVPAKFICGIFGDFLENYEYSDYYDDDLESAEFTVEAALNGLGDYSDAKLDDVIGNTKHYFDILDGIHEDIIYDMLESLLEE